MRTENTRVYGIKDAYMLETAYTLHSLFMDNIADFTAFDTSLDATFATDWLAIINDAASVVRDSQVKDIQAGKTVEVLRQMELCRIKYNEVKYFAGKAFPKDKVTLAEFGAEDYEKVRLSQALMVSFMDEMHKASTTYSTELLAAGMTQQQIDDLLDLRDSLLAANTDQENYMRARPKLTSRRIGTLNLCFETTMIVVNAAQVVYYNDYASRRMFQFEPTGGTSNPGPDSEIVNITVPNDGSTIEIFAVEYEPLRQIIIFNSGPADVETFISDAPNEMGTPMVVPMDATMNFTAGQLGPYGGKLYAKALPGTGTDATLEVQISLEL